MNATPSELASFSTLYPRLLHFGVSYGDLLRVSAGSSDWHSWSRRLADVASAYAVSGDEAWESGREVSAAEYWRRATDYFHFAQIKLSDYAAKQELQRRSRFNYANLAALLRPRAVRLDVPFGGASLPGYLRVAAEGAPCVILIGGLDSAKEVELHYFGECFLRRGLSVFFFDGPGQGELNGSFPMEAQFENAVSSVLDCVGAHTSVSHDGFGLFGVSFGGYLACRSAAADPRVKACISLGGFFDAGVLPRLPAPAVANLRRAFGLKDDEGIECISTKITLEPLRSRMDRPLFVIHGCDDHLVDKSQVSAIAEWAQGPQSIWMMEGAEHVCTNRFGECLPVMADWMKAQLAGQPAPQLAQLACEEVQWRASS